MTGKYAFCIHLLLLFATTLTLSGCSTFFQPAASSGATPTPNVFIDEASFQAALLQALADRDTAKLQGWVSEPFLTGTWRVNLTDVDPAEALKKAYSDQLGADNPLEIVNDADLKTLMGGADLPTLPNGSTLLVSGWGKDGRDEAILFIARQADNSLKWHGWLRIPGGFSGARLGGIQPFQSSANNYSLYLPNRYEIFLTSDTQVMILAPGVGHAGENRAAAFITVEPANGRTVFEAVDAVKSDVGSGFNITSSILTIEDAQAVLLNGLPGQDVNRQLFMVHDGMLYHLTFVPANPQAEKAYQQMEDLYAMIVNTFHFTK